MRNFASRWCADYVCAHAVRIGSWFA